MKKVLSFLRSMKFGLILLGLILICSIVGSLIPQGEAASVYQERYGWASALLALQFDHIFTSWYFILISALLCVNLSLCSILRIRRVVRYTAKEKSMASAIPVKVKLTAEGTQEVRNYLGSIHCRRDVSDGAEVYSKNSFGRYGTFLTHLGILLTVIFWALAMYLPKVSDVTCMSGDSVTLSDGTKVYVDSFSIEAPDGTLDYSSVIDITLPDGRESGRRSLKVNHPVSFGHWKIYQQTYGTRGAVTVTNEEGASDYLYLDGSEVLSSDNKNGILFDNLYPDFIQDPEGNVTLVSETSGSYKNPVYVFTVMENGSTQPMLAFPGDSITVAGLTYTFEEPVEYPGLRAKYTPGAINTCLLISFLIMMAGLAITFLFMPVLVTVRPEGYSLLSLRSEGVKIKLDEIAAQYGTAAENSEPSAPVHAGETPAEEMPAKETPADEMPAKETPAEETPAEEKSGIDLTAETEDTWNM